jgi:RHS repeat-associated protein
MKSSLLEITLSTTNYLYDGTSAVEDIDQSGSVSSSYTQGASIDEPLAQQHSGATSYYQANDLGSITSLTAATGTITATYSYDAFGKLSASTGSSTNRFQYTARESDADIALYYYRARYYSSEGGRFISEDPARFNAGYNFYLYAANDPVILVDPTGLKPCCSNEQDDIERRVNEIRAILNGLHTSGSITGVTKVGGNTFCVVDFVRLPSGQLLPFPHYEIDIKIDPNKHPCLYECTLMHERVHQRQCNTFGPTRTKLSYGEWEIPAYSMELV